MKFPPIVVYLDGNGKHRIGTRLKQTEAKWRRDRADRMATLCAVLDSHQWKAVWKNFK